MHKMGNRLVMNDSIVKKLENIFNNIFQASYSEIESKIISETKIDDNQTTDEDRFMFFIRCALLDFVSKFRFLMPKVICLNDLISCHQFSAVELVSCIVTFSF